MSEAYVFGQKAVMKVLLENGGEAPRKVIVETIRKWYGDSRARTVPISLERLHGLVAEDKKGNCWITTEGYNWLKQQESADDADQYIESKVYDRKQRKYIVTLKA